MTGIVAIFCGFLTLPLTIALLISQPGEIWWLGIVLFPTSVFFLFRYKDYDQSQERKK